MLSDHELLDIYIKNREEKEGIPYSAHFLGIKALAEAIRKENPVVDLTREEILEVRNKWMNEPQTFADRDAQAEGYARMLIAAYKEKNSIK